MIHQNDTSNLKSKKQTNYKQGFLQIFTILLILQILVQTTSAQTLKLNDILDSVEHSYPSLKMYDAEIQSQDAAVKGATNWESPQVSAGFFMTPYNTS
ncbi:MAG: hypothetical protein ABI290_06980, partial [Ginsengibacter sp.]